MTKYLATNKSSSRDLQSLWEVRLFTPDDNAAGEASSCEPLGLARFRRHVWRGRALPSIARDDNVRETVQLLPKFMRARLTKDFSFEAAQTLPNAPEGHKCRGLHGHSFKVEVSVEGDVDPKPGWVYDHAKISDAMKPLLKMLDHAYLNDIEGLGNPTIENMAEWFWKKLESQCPGLCEIVVHETPTARCVYRGN